MQKLLKTVLATSALILMMGCFSDDDESKGSSKFSTGIWRPTATTTVTQEKTTITSGPVTQSTDTTYTENMTYNDTTEIVVASEDSVIYYYKGDDVTTVQKFSNNPNSELEALLQAQYNEVASVMGLLFGGTFEIKTLSVSNAHFKQDGSVLQLTYDIKVVMEMAVTEGGLTVKTNLEYSVDVTDSFEEFSTDKLPPTDWPQTVVEAEL